MAWNAPRPDPDPEEIITAKMLQDRAHQRYGAVNPSITIRPTVLNDAIYLYVWRTHPSTQAMMRETGDIRWEDHLEWLSKTLEDTSRVLFIGLRDGQAVGTARLDIDGDEAEISVTVAPECRGGGVGTGIIQSATEWALLCKNVLRVVANVKPDNTASLKAFERAGYVERSRNETEVVMVAE